MPKFTSTHVELTHEEYIDIRLFCIKHGYTDLPALPVVVSGKQFLSGGDSPEVFIPKASAKNSPAKE